MAIQTQRSLSDLKRQAADLQLNVVQSGKRESKTDYILAIREHFLKGKTISPHLRLILEETSPMLCQQYKVIPESMQREIWNSNLYYLEQKMNGVRMRFICIGGRVEMYSRNLSVTDFLPIGYHDNVLQDSWQIPDNIPDFILDTEIMSTNPNIRTLVAKATGEQTESELQAITVLLSLAPEKSLALQRDNGGLIKFYPFDCTYVGGKWIKDRALIDRRKLVKQILPHLQKAGVLCSMPASNVSNKMQFHNMLLKMGKEGTVAKRIDSPYVDTDSRAHCFWIKIKRTVSQTMKMEGLGDTVDAYVTGFVPADEGKSWSGLIGALEFSVMLQKPDGSVVPHHIASVSNIPLDMRTEMSELDSNNVPRLKQEYYGKVAEIDGQDVSARAKRLSHAILVQWRDDKSPNECTMTEDFLNSMIL